MTTEKRRAYQRAYYEAHRDKKREYDRKYTATDEYKQKHRAIDKAWRDRNTDKVRETSKHYSRAIRQSALDAYGGKCACCGEDHYEFLAIDHIGGGGNEHRRAIGATSGQRFYYWLKRNRYPEGFRVLCHNCNMAMGFYGYCPHHLELHEA